MSASALDRQLSPSAAWMALQSTLERGGQSTDARFIDTMTNRAMRRMHTTDPGFRVYRARLMPVAREDDIGPMSCTEMRAPLPAKVKKAGRANPAGVAYFYAALDARTAVAEMRPWRGARITVAKFTSPSALSLVDLTTQFRRRTQSEFVGWLAFIMARPFHPDDEKAYLATQLIADRLRASGAQGVLYRSAMRPKGVNVVIFDSDQLICVARQLREVVQVSSTSALLTKWVRA